MLLKISLESSKPIYSQIIDEIKALIDQDVIGVQEPLPSTRALAKKLGVNRTTVVRAYEELQALGYLQSRPGSYNRVQKRRREVEYSPERKSLIPWEKVSSEPARELYELFLRYSPEKPAGLKFNAKAINISQLDPDPRLYPIDEFRRCLRHILKEHGPESLGYGTYKGYLPLRRLIARRLRLHRISVSEEEILVTNGAQQAIDLIIRLFADRRKKVVVEAPTYANIIPLIQFNGQKIVSIPMREDGMDVDSLERVLSREKVSFVYTIPNFQNPDEGRRNGPRFLRKSFI